MDVVDDGDLRKYRTEIPNMLDDSDLSVYAFRLYVHLKRVAGDSGQCFQGSRAIAKHCNMSPTSVVNAKHELIEKRLIRITPGDPARSTPDVIRITNVWAENFKRFSTRSIGEHPAPLASTPAPVMSTPRSIGEHPAPVMDHKKEQEQEVTKKEETKDRGSRSKPRSPSLADDDFLDSLQAKPAYAKLDVRLLFEKMSVWCEVKGKQPTRTRLINWLNREDQPISSDGAKKSKTDASRAPCRDCNDTGVETVCNAATKWEDVEMPCRTCKGLTGVEHGRRPTAAIR